MKRLIVWLLVRLLSLLYVIYQLTFPARIKTWLSDHAPYSEDSFAPAGFLEPEPAAFPNRALAPSPVDDTAWKTSPAFFGWLGPLVLLVIARNVEIRGTVLLVERRPANATWFHDTFYIAPRDSKILNRFALKCRLDNFDNSGFPVAKCWVPIGTQMPPEGASVVARGAWCADLCNRWVGLAAGTKRWMVLS